MFSWLRKRKAPADRVLSAWEWDDLLWGPMLPQKTIEPVQPPPKADENLMRFYAETEWMQPVFNSTLGGEGFRFHEVDTPYVILGTIDGPDDGRTFEVSFGSAMVGEVSVVPNYFGPPLEWADLRVRLKYPINLLPGGYVHDLLTGLVEHALEFKTDSYEDRRLDPRASAIASKAMVEALWEKSADRGWVVELRVEGTWDRFKSYVEHWKLKKIDPWEKWERQTEPTGDGVGKPV
ncbi:hypothetical protein AB2B41_19540 [Marimonas sp. MJW-29]|uniref:Uncharacterized protein n=1 Tax=Sulfitobacter sediminis TaxID=3234186 RepID=A0ABV3RSA4_9RHOB